MYRLVQVIDLANPWLKRVIKNSTLNTTGTPKIVKEKKSLLLKSNMKLIHLRSYP